MKRLAEGMRIGAALCLSLSMAGLALALLAGTLTLMVLGLVTAALVFTQELRQAGTCVRSGLASAGEWLNSFRAERNGRNERVLSSSPAHSATGKPSDEGNTPFLSSAARRNIRQVGRACFLRVAQSFTAAFAAFCLNVADNSLSVHVVSFVIIRTGEKTARRIHAEYLLSNFKRGVS